MRRMIVMKEGIIYLNFISILSLLMPFLYSNSVAWEDEFHR